jgi:hypothetical protein
MDKMIVTLLVIILFQILFSWGSKQELFGLNFIASNYWLAGGDVGGLYTTTTTQLCGLADIICGTGNDNDAINGMRMP